MQRITDCHACGFGAALVSFPAGVRPEAASLNSCATLMPHLVSQEVLASLITSHLKALVAVLPRGGQLARRAPAGPVALAQQLQGGVMEGRGLSGRPEWDAWRE